MKYPSIKNVAMILVAILLVGGAFVLAEYRNNKVEVSYVVPTVSTSSDLQELADSTDWKKILLSNDKASTTVKDLTKKPENLSAIDVISRDFFAKYLELNQIGISSDKLNQQELVDQTLNKIVFEKPKLYTTNSIVISNDNSVGAMKQYGNTIAGIFQRYTVNSRNEGVITKDALQRNDPEILKELDPIITSYKNIVNDFLKTPTPQNLSSQHLDLINAMNGALFVAQSFKKAGVDPIVGLQGASEYLVVRQQLFEAIKAVNDYFAIVGIRYSASEPGKLFNFVQ